MMPLKSVEMVQEEFSLLGVNVSLKSDTGDLFREFEKVFGSDSPLESDARLQVDLESSSTDRCRLRISGDDLADPAGYLLSFSSPTIPIRPLDRSADGWDRLALGQSDEETFRFRNGICEFRKIDRWQRIISHLLFLRLLRLRSDLIFFHAGSVDVAGDGVLLVGPKGTGKTTLTLALGSRGCHVLGDETAAYSPKRGELVPFTRPVAVKPGPRSSAIGHRIAELDHAADEDGVLRIPLSDFFNPMPSSPVPLRHMIFLRGFDEVPRMSAVQPGRDELALLQPLAASLVNQSPTQRVFELIRIVGSVTCWELTAGDPDQTAELIQHTLEGS